MKKTWKMSGIWMIALAAALVAAPAFADEFARTVSPFVQGVEINHPGYRAQYPGGERLANFQDQGDESGMRTAFYAKPLESVSAFAPQELTLQSPWSESMRPGMGY